MIGAGAKVLGNIRVGEGAKVGAGSVVLHEVPPHTTVAGVPAKPVSVPKAEMPALDMDQLFCNGDPIPDTEPPRPVIGTLAYLVRDGKVLMVHRSKQWNDHHLGKYNGLGGKLENGEDVVACLAGTREEAGVELTSFGCAAPSAGRAAGRRTGSVSSSGWTGSFPSRVRRHAALGPTPGGQDLPNWEGD